MVVGLLGGSFDPAHAGHVHITRGALKLFGLDRVWWLVSPGNPLKAQGPAPMARRLAHARALMRHPRVAVTDIEARLGTRHTAATLRLLSAPAVYRDLDALGGALAGGLREFADAVSARRPDLAPVRELAEHVAIGGRGPLFVGAPERIAALVRRDPNLRGVVLANHGLVTWGESARACYENTIATIAKAADVLNIRLARKAAFGGGAVAQLANAERRAKAGEVLITLRPMVSGVSGKTAHFVDSAEVLEFVCSKDLQRLAAIGTSCRRSSGRWLRRATARQRRFRSGWLRARRKSPRHR